MKSAAALFACVAMLLAARGAPAQSPSPTGDILEEFASDPRAAGPWAARGSWAWNPAAGTLVSGNKGSGSLHWASGSSYAGSILVRLKLISGAGGRAPRARVYFAHDPATGASRYVQLTAGKLGTIAIGQTGVIRGTRPRVFSNLRTRIPPGRWLEVRVEIGGRDRVTARLGRKALTATVAPLAPGRVGLGALASKVAFDRFSFTADPDQEPCRDCHAGPERPAGAGEVYTYWDGSWWDRARGGGAGEQQGGHGDPGGLFAMGCTGGAGCHDLRLPRVADHRNGVHEPRENMTANPWHLRREFINEQPARPWDVQMTFDDFCATACHEGFQVADMRHRGLGSGRPYLQLGLGGTDGGGRLRSEGIPLDADLTSAAARGPLHATCVTCHDPHGTGTTDASHGTNHMVRANWKSESALCRQCHY